MRLRPGLAPGCGRAGGVAPERKILAPYLGVCPGRRYRNPRIGALHPRCAPARCARSRLQAPPGAYPEIRRPRHGGRPDAGPGRLPRLRARIRRGRARTYRTPLVRAAAGNRRIARVRLCQRRGGHAAAAAGMGGGFRAAPVPGRIRRAQSAAGGRKAPEAVAGARPSAVRRHLVRTRPAAARTRARGLPAGTQRLERHRIGPARRRTRRIIPAKMLGFAPESSQDPSWKPNARTSSPPASPTTQSASRRYGGIFDYDLKAERLHVVNAELEDPAVWNDPKHAQDLGREKKSLETVVETLTHLRAGIADSLELFELAASDDDDATLSSIERDADTFQEQLEDLEFRRMFANPADPLNCFMDIQAGAGGTEAQDWASMLLRQYLKYAERKGFKAEVLEESEGEVAGLKSATIKIEGEYAFGYLRTE